MARELTSKTTTNNTSTQSSQNSSGGSSVDSSTSSDEGTTTKTDQQSGESVKTGESRQFANVALRVSFTIPFNVKMPVDPNSSC